MAVRLAELAAEIGSPDFRTHGAALATDMARMAGMFDEATEAAEWLRDPAAGGTSPNGLAEAGLFVLALTGPDAARATAPEPIDTTDPVAAAAAVMVVEALALADRVPEALQLVQRWQGSTEAATALVGTVGAFASPSAGLLLVLAGKLEEARPWLEAGLHAARGMGARPGLAIVHGLQAEITVRTGGTEDEARRWLEDVEDPGGVAGAVLLRARAVLREPGAAAELAAVAESLRAPGLLRDVPS
jgi:hypothetical protein